MKLAKSQIKRIDTFLENIGCEYIDIRFEMVDHIATDIEQDISDQNTFFKKDKLRGHFFLYMMSKKEEFEDSYYKQSKKQFWNNLWRIIKSVIRYFFNVKVITTVLVSFLLFQQLIKYNIKYTVISTVIISVMIGIFNAIYIWRKIKEIGKVRIVHSYYSIVIFLTYTASYIPNIFNIFKDENHIPFIANLHFIVICINLFVLFDFIRNKNTFSKKFKHLLN